ncbi:3-isopropylmalate dehydratase small subunit [Candidatus Omnitrophus magneticus]|uniref:3-isopropylmalate dehydratase small subunit n=1 Tax=Candidatus Omnitrophus magneticus TaxID=1609969 RepID=A0A0F0CQZ2_9BACT|nr:3-isopropylmalate dehydratase small subunit [Candidatus Omnitrophus magneticus]
MPQFSHRLKRQDNITTSDILTNIQDLRNKNLEDFSKKIFHNMEPDFLKKIKTGDFLVSGDNFGEGMDSEKAALALKNTGIKAVIAKSFDRNFFRDAFNAGLCVVECETTFIDDMDELELDLKHNRIKNLSKGINIEITPIHPKMIEFLDKGGVIEYFKNQKNF